LGVGLGAKPIMNTDVFCFGLPDTIIKKVPKGMLHPKRINERPCERGERLREPHGHTKLQTAQCFLMMVILEIRLSIAAQWHYAKR